MARPNHPLTACVDVGATSLKAMVLDAKGEPISERVKVKTSWPMTPQRLIEEVARLIVRLPHADRLALGFPGPVRDGVVLSGSNLARRSGPGSEVAPDLAEAWRGFELARRLQATFEMEARIANDADVAALSCNRGKGLELTVTLGTGFGTGLTLDGALLPHMELSQMRWSRHQSFDEVLGEFARKRDGESKWNARVVGALQLLFEVLDLDWLHLAGGNAPRVRRDDLGELLERTTVSSGRPGILGAVHLYDPQR